MPDMVKTPMQTPQLRLACFADETGQDTLGKFFLVATCIVDLDKMLDLIALLEEIENKSKKHARKWGNAGNQARTEFIQNINKSSFPKNSLFYSDFKDTKQYAELISLVIAKTVLNKVGDRKDYVVKIYFDRITKKTESKIKNELKKLKIKFRSVRGLKDESNSLIRLADSIAGFIRDFNERKAYAQKLDFFAKKIQKI